MKKISVFALLACCGLAFAQPATTTTPPGDAQATAVQAGPVAPPAPTWTDPEFAKVAALITGSWKTTAAVAAADGSKVDLVMHIQPVTVNGIPNALYVETARADALHRPTREALLQLYREKGTIQLRTHEFLRKPDEFGSATTGMWAAPDAFPTVFTAKHFLGTMDIALSAKGGGYAGKSVHPFSTSAGGAVKMTSEVEFSGSEIHTADRGFDAEGKQVWGPAAGEKYVFAKFTPNVRVQRLEGGLVTLDYTEGTGEIAIETGDRVASHYVGWLSDSYKFDSSRDRSTPERQDPLQFRQGGLIEGWNRGLLGAKVGTIRRLIIPAAMAYGERRRGMIPENAPLYFETEILSIDRPPAAPPQQPPTPPPAEGGQPAQQPATTTEQPK